MILKPWHSDTNLSDAEVRTLLQTHHPDLPLASLSHLDAGWDNDLFLVNTNLLFRFTRRDIVIPLTTTETSVLPLVQTSFPFPIPRIIHSGLLRDKYPYFSYQLLPGTIAANLQLSGAERSVLATPIADMLNALCDLKTNEALCQALPPDTFGRLDKAKRMNQIRSKAAVIRQCCPLFPTGIIEDLDKRILPADVHDLNCPVHGDLYARNILILERSKISGLIDWSDVHIGHPAKDFAFAVSFFPTGTFTIVKSLYRAYSTRLFFLASMSALSHTCHLAEYAIDIGDGPLLEECRTSFTNIGDNYCAFAS